jgi:peptidoglycan/LPS O-acetylase OafA/YrhL
MILLRFLALLAGGLLLVAAPIALFSNDSSIDGWAALATLIGLALVAGTFFFVAIAGGRMKKSPQLRRTGALLLALPFAVSVTVLWRGGDEVEMWASALLFCFNALLFLSFVFPLDGTHKQRPMRRREPLAG